MKMEKIFKLTVGSLKSALKNELIDIGYAKKVVHETDDYLYAEGDEPYMLIAHLDTVHTLTPSIICHSKDGRYMMSPQGIGGDDRCGVYIILQLIKMLKFKPYVLFTKDEEIGGVGARKFCNDYSNIDLKYIVEFDRKGSEDCVFYDCDNNDFEKFVEKFGFKTAYGSFSDISIIAPHLKVAAVNLSSAYYNPHTQYEYVDTKELETIIEKAYNMLTSDSKYYEYIEYVYDYSKYTSYNYNKSKVNWICPVCESNLHLWTSNKYGYCNTCHKSYTIPEDNYDIEEDIFDKDYFTEKSSKI